MVKLKGLNKEKEPLLRKAQRCVKAGLGFEKLDIKKLKKEDPKTP